MGFTPYKGLNDVLMRQKDNLYKYIGVYVDDLCIISKQPQDIINALEQKFQLKGTGSISFHLGCDFYCE